MWKKSHLVLWQKPLHPQKTQKGNGNTKTQPKTSITWIANCNAADRLDVVIVFYAEIFFAAYMLLCFLPNFVLHGNRTGGLPISSRADRHKDLYKRIRGIYPTSADYIQQEELHRLHSRHELLGLVLWQCWYRSPQSRAKAIEWYTSGQ